MSTVLGLDLGTNSIGWALVAVDENEKPLDILGMGSRIIPLNSDERDQFQKGQAISKNQERTTARTQRKGYDRKQLRKKELKTILQKYGIAPTSELLNLPSLDLWKLRADAVNDYENISKEQLGRILYMLNQKRGYKSARSEANQDKKDTDYVAEVKGRFAELKSTGKTIGQYFEKELSNAASNADYFRVKDRVFPREAYIEEFDKIMEVQKGKHPFLSGEVIQKLKQEIIYYQRKLKSQKGLVSFCELEGFEVKFTDTKTNMVKTKFVGPRVAPKTSPLFQLCKIWEVVNNISLKVKNPDGAKNKWGDRFPTLEEKVAIVNHLAINENLSLSQLITILKLKKENVYANKQLQKGIQGNITFSQIQKIVGESDYLKFDLKIVSSKAQAIIVDKKTGEITNELDGFVICPSVEQESFYQLWHTIYSIKDMDECRKALIKRFNFNEDDADKLSRLDFNKQSFGDKSNKAMRKILPYLMKGYNYYEATTLAGYNHSKSLTKDEQQQRETIDKLDLLPKNSLRQPVVEKILNQMINVVNAIVDKHGKPSTIRVELARELKQSKDERESSDKQNGFNKKLNELVANRLTELGLPSTKRYIQKYKFIFPAKDKNWKEADVVNQCIYCGESFNLTEALSGDNFDVDHIVPKALLFDDSQTNKVLVHRKCNSDKLAQTAYDYIAKKGSKELDSYLLRVDDWFARGIVSYPKMQRLKVSFEEYQERKVAKKETEADKKIWENFIDRQLRETAYISRKATELLFKICNQVTTSEGGVTAKLRSLWGWDDVLMNLQLSKYKDIGQTQLKEWTSEHGKRKHQKEEIANWTKRDDHRHHAIDALVVACTKQGFIQRINTLSSSETKDAMQREIDFARSKKKSDSDASIAKHIYKEKQNKLDSYLESQRPEIFTTKYVEEQADKILISFKAGKKVSTISRYKATGKNLETGVIVPRGALHEQFVYGKIKITDTKKSLKFLFSNPSKIINSEIRNLILQRLEANDNDPKSAENSCKKEPFYLDAEKTILVEHADCFKDEYVIKYKIQDLKTKDVPFIVDEKVKSIVKAQLDRFGGKEKEAFKEVVWFNKAKQIPILTVRCFTGLSAVEAIKKDEKGNEIGFAKTGNNHHIAIYKDKDGNQTQHICTFWHAVERKKNGIQPIIKNTSALWSDVATRELPQSFLEKLPPDNLELDFSMQQNEMFILGLGKEDAESAIKNGNYSLLSKYMYLVWSIADGDYWFRHHLETKNSDLKKIEGAKESNRFYRLSLNSLSNLFPIKVRLNHLGEITKIGE